mmetsp:Transcript_22503/g.49027  ORF Transcript_22503/g.49027 Transcript_22503/m.49027 type:complete len:214 (-) Transcript_22503:97-738(-)|eukprot:CAMPEP_0168794918 /NCGR_PEP_ID=MMETSP0725-20121227/15904_1 /TAXON_ID=265536 /ORGANISM="Amphiprora sp., Strain CCMP467" /LENGTH=213 /DNA_ID=CAMNT_0008845851 /DNA_START=30 /DNA_END=671 /DNA_ORIENTATION=-
MKAINVAITSDLLCPWCWVGLRKLQQAAKVAHVEDQLQITWQPYMLRPNAPPAGIPKGGTPESRVPPRLRRAGQQVGIDFTGLTDRTPNTTLFHATLHHLRRHELQTKFHEAVFEAYFTLGIYPDQAGLLKCAQKVGVEKTVAELYDDEQKLKELSELVQQEAYHASHYEAVNGVPSFAFNGEPAFSGAQEVDTFARYLNHYSNEEDALAAAH